MASLERTISCLARLCLTRCPANLPMVRNISTQGQPLQFRASMALNSEPMRKKKKVDPSIALEREKKRRKKLEREIRKLERKGRNLKPIDEIEGDRVVLRTRESRRRENPALTFEESEYRALTMKEWSTYKKQQHLNELVVIAKAMRDQERALRELRAESEELYQQAIQPDEQLLPFTSKKLLYTPPIEDYVAPDGDYFDTTKVFDK